MLYENTFGYYCRSLMDLSDAHTGISEKEISTMINTIFESVGLNGQKGMNLNTFKRIFLAKSTAPALQNGSIPIEGWHSLCYCIHTYMYILQRFWI